MLRGRSCVLLALCLDVWAVPAHADELQSQQLPNLAPPLSGHGALWGMRLVEWSYRGDFVVTDVQGRFCEGFKCAHGRGKLGTDGDWSYSGTFRYGDIVGSGELSGEFFEEDRVYSGLFSSAAFPGGPSPLCGASESEGDFPLRGHFGIQFYANQVPCAGSSCALLRCLKAWVESVDHGQTLPQEDAQRIKRWYEPVFTQQAALLGGGERRTFDKISLAGTELRQFLIEEGWKPDSDASVYVQRYLRHAETLQLILSGFQPPYPNNPKVRVSELLPMELSTGSSVVVINDPWLVTGLVVEISPNAYVLALRYPLQ